MSRFEVQLRGMIGLVLLFAGSARANGGASFYRAKDLGTLGGAESRAYSINEAGQVAGEAATSAGSMHAFVWSAADGMRDLGTLGGDTSRAHDVGESGVVVGEAAGTNGLRQPFAWSAAEGLRALPLSPGALGGAAHAVNRQGQIAGAIDYQTGPVAAFWSSPTNLPVLLTATGRAGIAFGINDRGIVVGQGAMADADNPVVQAFCRTPDGLLAGLASLPEGLSSSAQAINNAGQTVGWQQVAPEMIHAFRHETSGLQDLDGRNNVYSSAQAVNDGGDVAGSCFSGPDGDTLGFLRVGDQFYLLNELLETEEDLTVTEAMEITSDRRIAACGLKGNRERALLLTPSRAVAGALPGVRITQPESGDALPVGKNVRIVAEAAPATAVKRVVFVVNGDIIGVTNAKPYAVDWNRPPLGDADLVARAVTPAGHEIASPRVRVRIAVPSNRVPVVAWAEPDASVTNRVVGSNLLLRAAAKDADGRVVKMELWQDGTRIAGGEGAEWSENWAGSAPGSHAFYFVAEDEKGGRSTSAVRRIDVLAPP